MNRSVHIAGIRFFIDDSAIYESLIRLLEDHKGLFLQNSTGYLHGIVSVLMIYKHVQTVKIIMQAISMVSSLARYDFLMNMCRRALHEHGKSVTTVLTAHRYPLDFKGPLQHRIRKKLGYGFQIYTHGIRIDSSYQRITQDMYRASRFLEYEYATS